MDNIFDGSQQGWSVALLEEVNVGNWLRENEENIVFKIMITIDGEPTQKYFLSNLTNLEGDLDTVFFACNADTRVLLNEPYVKLRNIGLDYYLLAYNDNLWEFFFPNPNDDINSEYEFGDQSISSRKKLSKRCFYLNTNENRVSISTTPIRIPSNYYTQYLLHNELPAINCSRIDDSYRLITNVEHGIYKNNLEEDSSVSVASTISSVTPQSTTWLPKPSPENSDSENSDSDVSPLSSSPERGGRTRKRKHITKHKNRLKKTRKTKRTKSTKTTKRTKRTKKRSKSNRK